MLVSPDQKMGFSEQHVTQRKGMIDKKNIGCCGAGAGANNRGMRKSMDDEIRDDISDSESESDRQSYSDSWDEFERSVNEETERMLNEGGSFSPQDFANLLNSQKAPQVKTRFKLSHYLVTVLLIILVLTVTNALLKEHGYYVRCPGSRECASCYGPFWGKSWCPNPEDFKSFQ